MVNETLKGLDFALHIEFKKCLERPPKLIYQDPDKHYYLFTDAFKYCLGATHCQYT